MFGDNCNLALGSLKEAQIHRGWHKTNPTLKSIIGVLAISVALIIEVTTKRGYIGTFFKTPETDTVSKVNDFKTKLQSELKEIKSVIGAASPKTSN